MNFVLTLFSNFLFLGGGSGVEVLCKCECIFCFYCKEEAHRPATCESARKWILKNSAESENVTWITGN